MSEHDNEVADLATQLRDMTRQRDNLLEINQGLRDEIAELSEALNEADEETQEIIKDKNEWIRELEKTAEMYRQLQEKP